MVDYDGRRIEGFDPLPDLAVRTLADPRRRLDVAEADRAELENKLRRQYGRWLLILMALQIIGADVLFCVYGSKIDWKFPSATFNVWVSGTVIQVVFVVTVVVRYLFPVRSERVDRAR